MSNDLYRLTADMAFLKKGAMSKFALEFTPDKAAPVVKWLALHLSQVLQGHCLRHEVGLVGKTLTYAQIDRQRLKWQETSESPLLNLKTFSLTAALTAPWTISDLARVSTSLFKFERALYQGEAPAEDIWSVLVGITP